jgi:hypothetical protein
MILTSCCYCSAPIEIDYEARDRGGFAATSCVACGKTSVAELTSFGGKTYPVEEFERLFVQPGIVRRS